ncbi:DMT family transporter [Sporolactobacillus sp. THM7-4]|nr:DMT family transporter [Sporolactobacillus sp. THM7-4]
MKKKESFYAILFLLWGLAAGMVSPVQTAINAKLRVAVGSPVMATLISFFVGSLVLVPVTLIMNRKLTFELQVIRKSPWWLWIGGVLGIIFVISNILLLPALGSELTVVAIICGQMVIAMLIDHFGWFGVARHKINWQRIAGLVLLIAGVILIQRF